MHDSLTDDVRDDLSMYVLRLLPDEAMADIAEHLRLGCSVCASEIAEIEECLTALAGSAPPAAPPAGLRARILTQATAQDGTSQVWKQWDEAPPADLHIVRSGEGEWERVCEGVLVRRLYVDRERDSVTMLIRMEPGATYQPHRHAGLEQCLVLEGDLFDGVQEFHAGDFQAARENTTHGVQSTKNGCVLFIVSSLRDELLPERSG